ncbi:MAG: threonylcarbamoyl-AMP synthase [Cyclobacteriaceae bacterium]|nr:threonylcarbamoyl-AMP synthase [Cytophagales bacterium]MBX2898537.1 threonylcarbamoyl-AMP synthase [Cyclobacteriaceae bacterium]
MAEIGKDIARARQLLMEGHLVAIPTETVYGLAANALNEKAVLEIFKAKNRPHFDPLIVHVASIEQATTLATSFPQEAKALAKKFWPGPLTLLLPKKEIVPDLVTSGLNTVGIRCPDHTTTLQLLQSLPFPLAAPSANPFGYVSPTTPQHVNEQLGDKVAYIVDGGECSVGIESTIVGFEPAPTVYRLGGLALEILEPVSGPLHVQLHSTSNPHAPGQLLSHYAPHKKIVLGTRTQLLEHTHANAGAIVFEHILTGIPATHQIILSASGNLEEAAQHLFAALRALDKAPVDYILAEVVPDTGIGRAINDRLRRAATLQN